MKSKMKAIAAAVFAAAASKEFRPFEVRLARAVAVAVLGALGVKFGMKA